MGGTEGGLVAAPVRTPDENQTDAAPAGGNSPPAGIATTRKGVRRASNSRALGRLPLASTNRTAGASAAPASSPRESRVLTTAAPVVERCARSRTLQLGTRRRLYGAERGGAGHDEVQQPVESRP